MCTQNVAETIERIGAKRIADKLSVPYTTVHYWVTKGKVPHWRLAEAIRAIHATEQEDELKGASGKGAQKTYARSGKAKGGVA